MAEHKTDESLRAQPSLPDAQRRALLRAAVAAPVVATIPTGAALANTSAFQCVASSKTDSDKGFPAMSLTTKDQWVRVSALQRRFVTVDPDDPEGGGLLYDLWRYSSSDTDWYDGNGKLYANPNLNPPGASCDPTKELCAVSPTDTQTWVLRIYQPVPQSGVDPTGLQNPDPQRSPSAPFAYPRYSTAAANPPGNPDRPSQTYNIAVFGSCLCSVDPNSAPSGYC